MAEDSENGIISEAYHDFFDSQKATFLQARKQNNTITMEGVQKLFSNDCVRKTNLRGFITFIAHHPYHKYEIDLCFMPESDGKEYQHFF